MQTVAFGYLVIFLLLMEVNLFKDHWLQFYATICSSSHKNSLVSSSTVTQNEQISMVLRLVRRSVNPKSIPNILPV